MEKYKYIMKPRYFLLICIFFISINCSRLAKYRTDPKSNAAWVELTLNNMSLEDKIGQMIVTTCNGNYQNINSEVFRKQYINPIKKFGLGGFVLMSGSPLEASRILNHLQDQSKIPLLVSANYESGVFAQGATRFPPLMAIGATRSEEYAYNTGKIIALESRAIGVHQNYGPVLDVNNNPDNPIINTRSFGSDPKLVSLLGSAMIRGIQENEMIATGKHFPGHGNTDTDSHSELPIINSDQLSLERIELFPYKNAIKTDLKSIMTAHIAVKSLDGINIPATLSSSILTNKLRKNMKFDGLIVTDALNMGGITGKYSIVEAAIKSVNAGSNILLMPWDIELTRDGLINAVKSGKISKETINNSVRRILEVKAWLGLHINRYTSEKEITKFVGRTESEKLAKEIAEKSITLVKNEHSVIPVKRNSKATFIALTSDDYTNQGTYFKTLLNKHFSALSFGIIDPRTNKNEFSELKEKAGESDCIIVGAYVSIRVNKGTVNLNNKQTEYLNELLKTGKPVIVISFNNPYLIRQFPEIPVYLCAYSSRNICQDAVFNAITGLTSISGRLPIEIPGIFPYGHGIMLDKNKNYDPYDIVLSGSEPEKVGFKENLKESLNNSLIDAINSKIAPGGVLLVAKNGKIIYHEPFGKSAYGKDSPPVTRETVFDIASLTKVVVTTTLSMILYEIGELDLQEKVSNYYPEFKKSIKDSINIRHLLTHTSGLPGWIPLYKKYKGKDEYIKAISATQLESPPGSKTEYSDLGIILLGSIIEKIHGMPLEKLAQSHIFDPLNMKSTMYNPSKSLKNRIAPTEKDDWRGYIVHGEVHDENAYAMGGVAAHAGLFSTTGDLAKLCQMLLNGGIYNGKRILNRKTIDLFTARQNVITGSSRAIGWDTPSHPSSSGYYYSDNSFGHTGFTGTSIWVDRERDLFVILLTNRVYPTRNNRKISELRPTIHNIIMESMRCK